jgi:hypothetical protein
MFRVKAKVLKEFGFITFMIRCESSSTLKKHTHTRILDLWGGFGGCKGCGLTLKISSFLACVSPEISSPAPREANCLVLYLGT